MFFSVIVPVYNRERVLGRCISSVLSQGFADFEIIVVDDASTDASLARIGEFADPRLRILRHPANRGVGPTRNTGIAASRGEWLILLDSDDELVPGALARMNELAGATPASVHALFFRCRLDDGQISPDPLPPEREWDYAAFLAYLEGSVRRWQDMIRCVRRDCFRELRYADTRMAEGKFHFDFARRFRTRVYEDVLRLYHQDSGNQLTQYFTRLDLSRDAEFIRDRAADFRDLLREHGSALAAAYPNLYCEQLELAAKSAIVAGRRFSGMGYALRLVRCRPDLRLGWMLLAAGFIGPRAMTLQKSFKRVKQQLQRTQG